MRELNGSLTVAFTTRHAADYIALSVGGTGGNVLSNFAPTGTFLSAVQTGGTVTQTWRVTPPVGAMQYFVRLKATSR